MKSTCHMAMRYGGPVGGDCRLVGLSDASLPPNQDARATSGMLWILYVGGHPNVLSWHSRKQRHVCESTEHAELSAASEAAKEGIALKNILVELRVFN